MRARVVTAVLAAAVLAVGPVVTAQADAVPGPAVAVPGDDSGTAVVDVSEDDGTWSGSLEVTNASASTVELAVAAKSGLGDDCAPPEVSPDQVAANRVQSVTIEVSCEVPDGGAVVVLTLGPDDTQTVDVTLEPEGTEEPEWTWLLVVLVAAALAAAAPVVPVYRRALRRPLQKVTAGEPEWKAPVGNAPREPVVGTVSGSTPVTGAPTDWSLSESWASSFTALLALLTALVGSSETLTALLGTAPEGAEGQLLVTAAASALLVGMAPVVLKIVGPSSSPTVAGIAVGAWVTLTGTFLQVLALVYVLREGPLALPAVVLAAVVVLLLVAYAVRTLDQLFSDSFPDPGPEQPTAVSELMLLTAAYLGPSTGTTTVDRLVMAEQAARAYLDRVPGAGAPPSAPPGILPTGFVLPSYPPARFGTSKGDLRTAVL